MLTPIRGRASQFSDPGIPRWHLSTTIESLPSVRFMDFGSLTIDRGSRTPSGMAKKSGDAVGLRGAKLIKKALEAGKAEAFASPEPVAPVVLKRLVLPNGEGISPSMKELLKADALWLGIEFDEDEGDIEAVSFEDLIEDNFGASALHLFAEASELFDGDCIPVGGASDAVRFLYVGEADETGEYPVITVRKDPEPWVGGFVPFDVWVAQEVGAVEAPAASGAVAPQYEEAAKALAETNGDGRLGFTPTAGEATGGEEDEDDEEEDEADDDDLGDDEPDDGELGPEEDDEADDDESDDEEDDEGDLEGEDDDD